MMPETGSESEDFLDSDELGEKVESEFGVLCADAKLVANKSSRDRAGWDYNINARIDLRGRNHLDSRPNPLACIMQVKGMLARNDRIRVRLTSIEQLAKDPKPAFIYALKINEDLSLNSAYLIHFLGANLERVLEKLRRQELEPGDALNKVYLDFYASRDGEKLEPTGVALRSALEDLCGNDPNAYVAAKLEELKSIGFQENAIRLSATLRPKSLEELRDVFLGRANEVEATIDSVVETRFGIPIERLTAPSTGVLRFQYFPSYRGSVTLRSMNPRMTVVFPADIYVPPKSARDMAEACIRAKTRFFDFTAVGNKISVEGLPFSKETMRRKIGDWMDIIRCYVLLASGSCEFEIRHQGQMGFKGNLTDKARNLNYNGLISELEFASQYKLLMDSIGLSNSLEITYTEMLSQRNIVSFLYNLLSGISDPGVISFELEENHNIDFESIAKGRINSFIMFGEQMLLWSAIMEMDVSISDNIPRFRSQTVSLQDLRLTTPTEYIEFVESCKNEFGIDIVMSKEPSGDDTDITIVKITSEQVLALPPSNASKASKQTRNMGNALD